MSDGAGFLEVGTNAAHEVVINLPRDMTGHVVFSPQQARALANSLLRKAADAERAQREQLEAERVANVPPVDRSRTCTTSGESPDAVRAGQVNETGQHSAYIVLCEEERQKGFVRPYRDAYKHVGLQVCGKRVWQDRPWNQENPVLYVCALEPGHEGDCGAVGRDVANEALAAAIAEHHFVTRGCGAVTTMTRALSETYARDPGFYGSTFCVRCNRHLPVAEFTWTADGQRVGS